MLTAGAIPSVLEAEVPVNHAPATSSVMARSSVPEERGALTEEREAMWVNVLVLLGRRDDARARREALQARFLNSLMGANVRAALRAARVEE